MDCEDLQEATGTGFGCLIIRRSILKDYVLSGDNTIMPHYDVEISHQLYGKWKWFLDRTVKCNHMIKVQK